VRYKFFKLLQFALLIILSSAILTIFSDNLATAATLQLTWADNSSDEMGFHVERKLGSAGVYNIIATTGANQTSYTDSGLADSTTYCYRVNAFNNAGISPYSPEICGTTPAPPVAAYTLTVSSQGSGSVSSSPAGINCGATCTANFASGSSVTLTPIAANGYTFSGWSGDADCLDGSVTINTSKTCTATFTANPVVATGYVLTVNAVGTITAAGSGSGKIVSSPTGIDCGGLCSATFQSGAIVTLQAVPAAGSTFTGWSGDADCLDGSVTMNASKSCSASFKLISYGLTVSRSGTGTGVVTSSVGGINCGISCGADFVPGTVVKLIPSPAVDSVFSGWSGDADCSDGSVTMNVSKSCTASFTPQVVAHLGLNRPSTGAWYLLANSTGLWQGCNVDYCMGPFGSDANLPIIGDWDGSGKLKLGLYTPASKNWQLDTNDNASWEGCRTDACYNFAVAPKSSDHEIPLVGRWITGNRDLLGVFRLETTSTPVKGSKGKITTTEGYWYLDTNGNGKWDGCNTDLCFGPFGGAGDLPVVGDWNGNGLTKIGVFTPQTGMWTLDFNGNGKFDGCAVDKCFGPFGSDGDVPVVGDWSGTGTAKIGVFRASTGEWFLDMNGNGQWDGCNVDKCVSGFGQTGDLPVSGKW
jgi:Divergent InlB B-repeat domain